MSLIRIGTAGWNLPPAVAASFPGAGSHLERYARVLPCVEINSTFYRAHRRSTYERWARSVPPGFLFSVKLRKTITHEHRLEGVDDCVGAFIDEVAPLLNGGVLLVQLPPKLAFSGAIAERFFNALRSTFGGRVACEPRHASWFSDPAEALLAHFGVARVAADPAILPAAASPGGDRSFRYFRWHGTPRVYWSTYDQQRLTQFEALVSASPGPAFCIFDNTAHGGAIENALTFDELVRCRRPDVRGAQCG
ncbi:MAG TPA: DUF72 domain-containing protein [Candidatus Sulfotelmatobacter sp.]|nr:DUF72 domain-containing protein [Candidatus Sulfotelmatobacter sp.]